MISSLDVGNFFIDMSIRTGNNDITNMKLNKLVYFAQVWALAKLGRPLFAEDVQAWKDGPVIPTIYHSFKQYGGKPIDVVCKTYSIDTFTPEEIDVLGDVYLRYGNYASTDFMRITHEPGSPWNQKYTEGVHNIVIPKKTMQEYYQEHPNEFNVPEIDIDKIPRVGYRDEEGALVLPIDMYCQEDDIFDRT